MRRRRGASPRPESSRFALADADVEHFLVSGEHRGLLEEYFGEAVQAGRKRIQRDRDIDWVDYIH